MSKAKSKGLGALLEKAAAKPEIVEEVPSFEEASRTEVEAYADKLKATLIKVKQEADLKKKAETAKLAEAMKKAINAYKEALKPAVTDKSTNKEINKNA